MKTDLPFFVQWSEGPAEKRLTWWLMKSAQPNRYYGEITDYSRQLQTGLDGSFVDGDLTTVHQLIDDIRQLGSKTTGVSKNDGYALLALGSRAKPDIIFRYSNGSENANESARLFLRIVDILGKYVDAYQNSAKSA